jgi:hypothetical protein
MVRTTHRSGSTITVIAQATDQRVPAPARVEYPTTRVAEAVRA